MWLDFVLWAHVYSWGFHRPCCSWLEMWRGEQPGERAGKKEALRVLERSLADCLTPGKSDRSAGNVAMRSSPYLALTPLSHQINPPYSPRTNNSSRESKQRISIQSDLQTTTTQVCAKYFTSRSANVLWLVLYSSLAFIKDLLVFMFTSKDTFRRQARTKVCQKFYLDWLGLLVIFS